MLKQVALEKLSLRSSKESLLTWISWLDFACSSTTADALPNQLLARSCIALGYSLVEREGFALHHPVMRTLKTAEAYALVPTEENLDDFQAAATASYPFGPGDGCFAISETGYDGCELGSGCRSGTGSLASQGIDAAVAMEIIAGELTPWLQGDYDPVRLRLKA